MRAGMKHGCAVCGREAGFGSVVVLAYGRGGRVHKSCVALGQEVRLADGSLYKRPRETNSDAAKGIPRKGAA